MYNHPDMDTYFSIMIAISIITIIYIIIMMMIIILYVIIPYIYYIDQ